MVSLSNGQSAKCCSTAPNKLCVANVFKIETLPAHAAHSPEAEVVAVRRPQPRAGQRLPPKEQSASFSHPPPQLRSLATHLAMAHECKICTQISEVGSSFKGIYNHNMVLRALELAVTVYGLGSLILPCGSCRRRMLQLRMPMKRNSAGKCLARRPKRSLKGSKH